MKLKNKLNKLSILALLSITMSCTEEVEEVYVGTFCKCEKITFNEITKEVNYEFFSNDCFDHNRILRKSNGILVQVFCSEISEDELSNQNHLKKPVK